MYLGIDFLLAPDLKIFVVDVNLGLPGGAEEYERANLVKNGQSSGIFERIEETARTVYGLSFREYLNALPFIPDLKQMKLWMDGKGELPEEIHPALRLEDKWIQYGLLHDRVPMPETMLLDRQMTSTPTRRTPSRPPWATMSNGRPAVWLSCTRALMRPLRMVGSSGPTLTKPRPERSLWRCSGDLNGNAFLTQ